MHTHNAATTTTTTPLIVAALLACATAASASTITISSAAPENIPDLGAAELMLTPDVPQNPLVASIAIDLDLAHGWLGDLVITIEHEGVTVRLIERMGLAIFPFACGGNDILATFDDAGTLPAADLCWPGPAPTIYGTVAPLDPLSAFAGLAAEGDWTIRIEDASAYDDGVLNSITLRIETAAPTECVGDISGDGATNAADFTILAGNFGDAVPPNTAGDLSGDGLVTAADFTILAGDFGCAPQ